MSFYNTLKFITTHPLNRSDPFGALLRFARWQLQSRIRSGVQVMPFFNGTRFYARRGWKGVTGNIYCGLHDYEEMNFLMHYLRHGDLFVDIGANMGSYTILASGVSRANTIAIEPIPETFDRLQKNIELNELNHLVTVLNAGAGSSAGHLSFTCHNDTTNRVATDSSEPVIQVAVKPIDQIIPAFPFKTYLFKVDVEGFEMEVLKGAEGMLNNDALKAIIIELNGSGKAYGINDKDVHEYLKAFGFMPFRYFPAKRKMEILRTIGHTNTIYIRDDDFVMERLRSAVIN